MPEEEYQDGWSSSPGLEQVETVLVHMGFEKATSQRNHLARDFKDGLPTTDMHKYAVWIHPAGAIVQVSSKDGGRVRNMDMHMEVDAGVYGRNLSASLNNCGGSGSCEPQLSGKSHYCKSWNWHSNILGTLQNLLKNVQAAGRIVPFTHWNSDEIYICGAFPLEALVQIGPELAAGKSERDIRMALQDETEAAIEEKFAKWAGLKEMVAKEMIDRCIHQKILGAAFHDRDWWRAENAMDYCRRVMMHSSIRWPNAKTQALTEHWLLGIGSGALETLTVKDKKLLEPGPGGARFATCLALEVGRENGWEKFTGFLDSMSDDQVRDWAGSVDAQGNTPFGELVFSHATQISSFLPDKDQIIDLFNVVSQRVGAGACPVTISNKKPWLVMEEAFEQIGKTRSEGHWNAGRYIRNLPLVFELFERLEAHGCPDVLLDSQAMEMVDRMRDQKVKIDSDNVQGIEDIIPANTMARIAHMMMEKTVGAPKGLESRQIGRL